MILAAESGTTLVFLSFCFFKCITGPTRATPQGHVDAITEAAFGCFPAVALSRTTTLEMGPSLS
jgi:hypothetical protein